MNSGIIIQVIIMLVSTKGRYALRVMLDLATQPKGEYISLKSISERQNISMKYLEAIVATINKAGMLDSQRGKSGGYRLAKEPNEYDIYSIIKLTDGSLAPIPCLDSGSECTREEYCSTRPMWNGLYEVIKQYLESKTLADLMSEDNYGADI
jgi:Rrf2 family iron-sulfur cluster assembly transcriptional regulator